MLLKSQSRRCFLAKSGALVASSTLLLPAGFGCSGSADDDDDNEAGQGFEPVADWQTFADTLEDSRSCCYTAVEPDLRAAADGGGSLSNHLPVIEVDANGNGRVYIEGGHPMVEDHWITTIYVRDQRGIVIALRDFGRNTLQPQFASDAFEHSALRPMTFQVPPGTTTLQAFTVCSLHDTWASGSTPV